MANANGEDLSGDAQADETDEQWAFITKLLLPAVTAARQCLPITEAVFRTHTFHADPRAFLLWTALDEVLKTGVFLMRLDGLLDGEVPLRPGPDAGDPTERAIEAVILEEERLRARRLCEVLTQLVLFAQKNDAALYRHFLLLEELVGACGYNQDLNEFHAAQSGWVQATIDSTIAALREAESGISFADAWYAKSPRPATAATWQGLLSSARQRLIRALPLMTDFERLALGTTYAEAFGNPSGTIHFRAGSDAIDHSRPSSVVAEGTKLGMIALCVIHRCYELLGRPSVAQLEQIARALESNQGPGQLMRLLNDRPLLAPGEFVLARGYLGQIMEARVSPYGYRSVRVEFLAELPVANLTSDWFRTRDVHLLFTKAEIVERVRAASGTPNLVVDETILRESVVSGWAIDCGRPST